MNIDGLSIKTLEQLYDKFNVSTFSDLYKLSAENLAELEGFKEKKINNALSSIEKSKHVKLSNFIFALGIGNIGVKTAKQLAKHYKNINSLKNATVAELIELDDIAEITATEIYDYFNDDFNKNELCDLLNNFVSIEEESKSVQTGGYFEGKKVVITGTLSSMGRSAAENLIEEQGGSTSSSVTSQTNILIVGENAGSKLDKAKKLGTFIMTEDEFLKLTNKK
jgi:DNA ligase (NAD+)